MNLPKGTEAFQTAREAAAQEGGGWKR